MLQLLAAALLFGCGGRLGSGLPTWLQKNHRYTLTLGGTGPGGQSTTLRGITPLKFKGSNGVMQMPLLRRSMVLWRSHVTGHLHPHLCHRPAEQPGASHFSFPLIFVWPICSHCSFSDRDVSNRVFSQWEPSLGQLKRNLLISLVSKPAGSQPSLGSQPATSSHSQAQGAARLGRGVAKEYVVSSGRERGVWWICTQSGRCALPC